MADFAHVESGAVGSLAEPVEAPGAVSVLFNWVGACLSVALVIGLCVWGYNLAMRDVSGVPVVRALEGPMRIAPDDPGGSQAAHQGLAVNSVAGDGAAEAPADRVVLAPAAPELEEEDLPRPELAQLEPVDNDPSVTRKPTREELLAMADALAEGVTPLAGTIAPPTAIPTTIAGVTRSPFPKPRPVGDLTAAAIATDVALAVARPAAEVDASSVPAGTRLVQFGAYDSPDAARAVWDTLEVKFSDFLRGKQRVVQEAKSGGKTFYRLRAMGFADINDARRFCAALVADRQACIPVVVR